MQRKDVPNVPYDDRPVGPSKPSPDAYARTRDAGGVRSDKSGRGPAAPELALDFEVGGIYDREAVERMDLFFHTPNAAATLASDMAKSALEHGWTGRPSSGMDWASAEDLGISVTPPYFDPLHMFTDFFRGYERWCSLAVGTVVTFKLVTWICLLYTSPSPRDKRQSRMPSSA